MQRMVQEAKAAKDKLLADMVRLNCVKAILLQNSQILCFSEVFLSISFCMFLSTLFA